MIMFMQAAGFNGRGFIPLSFILFPVSCPFFSETVQTIQITSFPPYFPSQWQYPHVLFAICLFFFVKCILNIKKMQTVKDV